MYTLSQISGKDWIISAITSVVRNEDIDFAIPNTRRPRSSSTHATSITGHSALTWIPSTAPKTARIVISKAILQDPTTAKPAYATFVEALDAPILAEQTAIPTNPNAQNVAAARDGTYEMRLQQQTAAQDKLIWS